MPGPPRINIGAHCNKKNLGHIAFSHREVTISFFYAFFIYQTKEQFRLANYNTCCKKLNAIINLQQKLLTSF